ncbi:aconitate hydratase AcnA [Myceligenerans pegani]|uniref:Aconitate hydratase n=1 Tax=Myceligenerans pegani TaxID=2776917 RepID=A0ABR9N4F8_9MICO|nr:aconitate hydratase AcnA [Myceligenerans sp. TRM 65318]MBE1878548.1 aconitate hydratase AcnA [Myceligenerans sp. TRM 65318]MBE3020819.1 aconitate hydratase AcnA [Myceligenerans sp. TRM 65318]
MSGRDSFGTLARLDLAGVRHQIHRLTALPGVERLPLSTKIILENLLRHEDGENVTAAQIASLLDRDTDRPEVDFRPSRIFLHDTNGVPLLTDLAALRDAVADNGGDPAVVKVVVPAELTVDHSVATDHSTRPDARERNIDLEYARNTERYRFLRWGSRFDGLRVIPPGAGIMHQINLERLARVVERRDGWAFPDTCLGTDSHTTMINGLGVLGWGIGGIEAEAAMLGLPVAVRVPPVVGVELTGALVAGVTATDLVLTLTQRLRAHGVVGSIVEFFGAGADALTLETRATIANMAPEYGATCGLFAVDDVTLAYLRLTGRSPDHVAAVEAYCKEQLLWHDPGLRVHYDERLVIDLSRVEASVAGPGRPQDRMSLAGVAAAFRSDRAARSAEQAPDPRGTDASAVRAGRPGGGRAHGAAREPAVPDGAVAIAAITSCTNTANPHVMVAAGLLARNARRRGLSTPPWVKTSLAPGSRAVTSYLHRTGLDQYLDELGFHTVGYGCMTCIGNSGDLLPAAGRAVHDGVTVAAVLSGNRNFDRRIHNDVGLNYLASPPLVVAYALAGTVDRDLTREPLGTGRDGRPVHLAEIWPDDAEIHAAVDAAVKPDLYDTSLDDPLEGDSRWAGVDVPGGVRFAWQPDSTYVRRPPFLEQVDTDPPGAGDILDARVLAHFGDSVTTDHISPAGRIPTSSPAGRYLAGLGVTRRDLNTYASRRGNFEVMRRGGFSNPALRNLLLPDRPGGLAHDVTGRVVSVFEAAESYARAGTPLVIVAGAQYGSGSSRDWAAKVTALLGVRAVLARSFERIHRTNLVQMGVLPLELPDDQIVPDLGHDTRLDVLWPAGDLRPGATVTVRVCTQGRATQMRALVRIDTEREAEYVRHGGILPYVFRTVMRETVS